MAIESIKFGKNLRPSTVEVIKKVNELITVVNQSDPDAISALQTSVTSLQANVKQNSQKITTAEGNIDTLQDTSASHTTDIDKIKVTLYTPLSDNDTKE